jgi:hypothetical protein
VGFTWGFEQVSALAAWHPCGVKVANGPHARDSTGAQHPHLQVPVLVGLLRGWVVGNGGKQCVTGSG